MKSENDDVEVRQKLVAVDDVDKSGRSHNSHNNTTGSVNRQGDEAIDHFIEDNSISDSAIRKDMMKSSRYSYMVGEHGFTVN